MSSWADIEIAVSEWSVFCHDCVAGTFTETEEAAEKWEAEHRASDHSS
jgi:hypothetical protein